MSETDLAGCDPGKARLHKRYGFLPAALLLFILVALVIHYPAFHAPMQNDSLARLEANEFIFASGDVIKVIQICPQRPVPMVTFYLNYLIWGMNPFYFRVVNAIILAATALIAAVACMLLLDVAGPTRSGSSSENLVVSLCLGLVFLVHPVQIYIVDYIWQRMELLCCFFYVAAFATYLAARRTSRISYKTSGYAL